MRSSWRPWSRLRELASSSNRRLPTSDERDALTAVNVTFFQAYSRNRHLLRVMREAAAVSGNDGFGRLWLRTRADFESLVASR